MYFTLDELCRTQTGLPNTPPPAAIDQLTRLIETLLNPAREAMGMPIRVNSGYRSEAVNRAVGGAPRSYHLQGRAADITCADNLRLLNYLRRRGRYTELIGERPDAHGIPRWIHVAI